MKKIILSLIILGPLSASAAAEQRLIHKIDIKEVKSVVCEYRDETVSPDVLYLKSNAKNEYDDNRNKFIDMQTCMNFEKIVKSEGQIVNTTVYIDESGYIVGFEDPNRRNLVFIRL